MRPRLGPHGRLGCANERREDDGVAPLPRWRDLDLADVAPPGVGLSRKRPPLLESETTGGTRAMSGQDLAALTAQTPATTGAILAAMSDLQRRMIGGLTPGERDYIRRELDLYFTTLPAVAEGFQLRVWRTGPRAGQAKLPPAAKSLVARGLMARR